MKDKQPKFVRSFYSYIVGLVLLMLLLTVTAWNSTTSNSPKLAFAVMVHNENTVEGAIELMDILYPSDHCFLIHFDKNTPIASMNQFLKLFPFVLVAKSFNVEWGKYSMIEAELELLKVSRQCEYDHLMFMDGQTFPLKRTLEIELQLQQIPKSNSIVFSRIPEYGTDIPTCKIGSPTKHACARTLARCEDVECTTFTRTPHNAPLYKGPQWSVLSTKFIAYMLSNDEWLSEWNEFFEQTVMPDEQYFQTLLMDSPFKDNKSLLEEDWMKTVWKDCKTYVTTRSKRGYSPCTLGIKDYSVHLEKSKSLFARKIRAGDQLKSIIMQEG